MGVRGLDGVVELDVLELRPPDDQLLLLHRKGIPGVEVVEILLHDDVAPPGVVRFLVADDGGVGHGGANRILRAVDESEQVSCLEVPEAVHLVGACDVGTEPAQDRRGELETQIEARGPNVEQEVAGSRRCDPRPGFDGGELVQVTGA